MSKIIWGYSTHLFFQNWALISKTAHRRAKGTKIYAIGHMRYVYGHVDLDMSKAMLESFSALFSKSAATQKQLILERNARKAGHLGGTCMWVLLTKIILGSF